MGSLVRDGEGKPLITLLTSRTSPSANRPRQRARKRRQGNNYCKRRKWKRSAGLAGGIAHDFNNMLAVILLREMSLPLTGESTPLHYNLSSIHGTAQRSADLVRQLLGFAQTGDSPKSLRPERHHRGPYCPCCNRSLAKALRLPGIPRPASGASRWIRPDRPDLANLCSPRATPSKAPGQSRLKRQTWWWKKQCMTPTVRCRAGDYVAFSVTDDGCGIDDALLPHIFEPFFTTWRR